MNLSSILKLFDFFSAEYQQVSHSITIQRILRANCKRQYQEATTEEELDFEEVEGQ